MFSNQVLPALWGGVAQQDPPAQADTTTSRGFQDIVDVLGVDVGALIQQGLKALLILVLAWVAVRVLKGLTGRVAKRYEGKPGEPPVESAQRVRTLVQLLNSVGVIVIAVAAGLSMLNLFIDIGPLLAGVGVLGLAVSFGAQSLVKDVISGFFVLFEGQFDVGDVVEIGGVAGVVERMTLRVVALRDLDGVVHIIPNGSITQVSNKTSGWARAVVDVGVAYDEDVDRVIDTLGGIATEFWEDETWRQWLAEVPTVLGVNELGDSAVVVRIMVKTSPGKQWEVKRELRRRIKKGFDAANIEIPFPQRTVHVKEWRQA